MRHLRFAWILAMIAAAAVATSSCKKKEKEKGKAAASKKTAPNKLSPKKPIDEAHESAGNAAEAHVGDKPVLSAADYEKLMFTLKSCSVEGIRVSAACPALRRLVDYRRARRLAPEVAALSAKHIGNASVPIRIHAATMMRSFLAATDANVNAGLAAAKTEKNPAVLANLVRALHPDMKTNKDITALLLELSSHGSPLVRGEVIAALVSQNALGTEGTIEKAIEMIESDADDTVRERGCRDLGRRVDDKALPLLEKMTAAPMAGKKVGVYNACWDGLATMVVNYPFLDASSEKAYALLIKRLSEKTCSMQTPPFRIFAPLGNMSNPKLATIAPWFEGARPELQRVISTVVLCEGANWMARSAAIDALAKSKADKKMLLGLKTKLGKRKKDKAAARLVKKLAAATR